MIQGLPGIDGKDGTPGIPGIKVAKNNRGARWGHLCDLSTSTLVNLIMYDPLFLSEPREVRARLAGQARPETREQR